MRSQRVGHNWGTFTFTCTLCWCQEKGLQPTPVFLPGKSHGQRRPVCYRRWYHKESDTTAAAAAKSLPSCPTLCDPRDGSLPGSPIPGNFQARTLEWVFISFSNAWKWKVAQLCPTLSDPMDCSLPGSSAHGIFQAPVLEWGAIAFSLSQLSD